MKEKIARYSDAYALISSGDGLYRHFLLQWDAKWGMYNMMGCKQTVTDGDKSILAGLLCRELEQNMGLCHAKDFSIVRELKPIQLMQHASSDECMIADFMTVFEVEIFPRRHLHLGQVSYVDTWAFTAAPTIFVSRAEIDNLLTRDGMPISLITKTILQESYSVPQMLV